MALKVLPGPRLAERTTLRLGGRARAELRLESAEDCHALAEALAGLDALPTAGPAAEAGRTDQRASAAQATQAAPASVLALGWGSNLLALDADLALVVVSLAGGEPEIVGDLEEGAPEPGLPGAAQNGREGVLQRVRVPGGVMLPKLISWAAARGLSGLEGLAGIPCTVGGAVAMNAGSYGRQMADLLARVRLWTPAAGLAWSGPEGWTAGYRHFRPLGLGALAETANLWLAVEAELLLSVADPAQVQAAVQDVLARKKATQPVGAATCGCVFKNPVLDGATASAGKLLDACGFKGKHLGGMAFSAMHANFLVNENRGTARAALELIDQARQAVAARFGVNLELEVRVVR